MEVVIRKKSGKMVCSGKDVDHIVMRTYFIKIFQGRQPWVRRISGQNSSLQAALLVLVIYYVGEFFHNGRGRIVLLKNTHIYTSIDYLHIYKKYSEYIQGRICFGHSHDKINTTMQLFMGPAYTFYSVKVTG